MNPVTGLALGRIAVGVGSLVKPDLLSTTFAPNAPPAPPLVAQWFGTREVALGVLVLASRGSARRNLVLAGMAIDAADAATTYVGLQNRTIPRELGWAVVAIASGAVLAGPLGLVRRTRKAVATA